MPLAAGLRALLGSRPRVLKALGLSLGVSLLAFAAAWLGVPNRWPYFEALDGQLAALAEEIAGRPLHDDLRLIVVAEDDVPDLADRAGQRAEHARLVRALAGAGAAVVAFDVSFSTEETTDAVFAEAIGAAAPTAVVLGCEPAGSAPDCRLSPALEAVLGPAGRGSVLVAEEREHGGALVLRSFRLASSRRLDAVRCPPAVPTFPLQVALARRRGENAGEKACLDPGARRIELRSPGGERRIPCDVRASRGGDWWHALQRVPLVRRRLDRITRPYDLVQRWIEEAPGNLAAYAGKVVLVGARSPEDLVEKDPPFYGHEVQALIVSRLLQDVHVRSLGPLGQVGFLLALCLAACALRVCFPRSGVTVPVVLLGRSWTLPVPLLGLLSVYLAGAFLAYLQGGLLLDVVHHGAAMAAAYFGARWLLPEAPRRKAGFATPELLPGKGAP